MANPDIPSIEHIAVFCKRKGIVYPSAELYGGLAGFFDFGPLGVEISNNIKQSWWTQFVKKRQDVVGMDGNTITSEKIWKASGHLDNFTDPIVKDTKTGKVYRADQLIENTTNESMEGKSPEELFTYIKEKNILSPDKNPLEPAGSFNLMFPVSLGAGKGTTAYLRGETAQVIFTQFKNITQTTRVQLPFGIAQIGRAYRNEISPRDFLFRVREFEQMELEYFFDPDQPCAQFTQQHGSVNVTAVLGDDQQEKQTTIQQLVDDKRLEPFHAYWLVEVYNWFQSIGIHKEHLRLREHTSKELSHYSKATFDWEYDFPQMGFKELLGCAHRGDFDLKQHQEHSKTAMAIHDDKTGKKILPHVIEPSFGLGRTFLAVLCDAYKEDKKREQTILSLHPTIAPQQVAVFPLVKKLDDKAKEIFALLDDAFICSYDVSGSIGKRYARQDEIGTPLCVTVDFDTLEDNAVTVRDRDTTKQVRISIDKLETTIRNALRTGALEE